jgi:hypothetical protein
LYGSGVLVLALLAATLWHGAANQDSAMLLRLALALTAIRLWSQRAIPVRQLWLAPVGLAAFAWGASRGEMVGTLQAGSLALLMLVLFLAALGRPTLWREAATWMLSVHAGIAIMQAVLRFDGVFVPGQSTFVNPSELCALLAPTLVLLVQERRWPWAAIMALGALATGSRSGLLACAGAALPLLPRRALWPLVLCFAGAAIALIASRLSVDPYATDRVAIWQAALQVLGENPLGVGIGAVAEQLRLHGVLTAGVVRYPKVAHGAHSEPLQLCLELGIVGVLLLVATALWLRPYLRRSDLPVLWALVVPALFMETLRSLPMVAWVAFWTADLVRSRGLAAALPLRRAAFAALALIPVGLAAPAWIGSHLPAHLVASVEPWRLTAQLNHLVPTTPAANAAALERLGVRFPTDPRPWLRAARQWERAGDRESALDALDVAVTRAPRDVSVHYALANLALRAQKVDLARTVATQATRLEPNFARGLALLALLSPCAEATAHVAGARHATTLTAHRTGYALAVLQLDGASERHLAHVDERCRGLGRQASPDGGGDGRGLDAEDAVR